MWGTKTLDLAFRRFRTHPEPADYVADVGDVDVSLIRGDLDRLVSALGATLGPSLQKPDSPLRLEQALSAVIDRIGGCGQPVVTRSPAGLYTPEYWHIRVEGADLRAREAVGRLAAGERIG